MPSSEMDCKGQGQGQGSARWRAARGVSAGRDFDGPHGLVPEQRHEARTNEACRSFHFATPRGILGAHVQHAVPQFDRRGAIDRGSHRDAPGKGNLLLREGRVAQNGLEGAGHHLVNGNHAARIALNQPRACA